MLAAALAGLALTPSAVPPGLYDGTIGSLPVRLCMAERHGAYYYRSRLVPIMLSPVEGSSGLFSEGNGSEPSLSLRGAVGEAVIGEWRSGSRRLPVRLRSISFDKGEFEDDPCASKTFQAPRLEGVRIVRSEVVQAGQRVTLTTLDTRGHFPDFSIVSLQLPGAGSAVAQINRRLFEPFRDSEEADWKGCDRGGYWGGGTGASYDVELTLTLATRRWLAVMERGGGFCEGAHPDEWSNPLLFDRRSGAEVELLDWLSTRAVTKERLGEGEDRFYRTLTPAFRAVLMKRYRHDDECTEAVADTEGWSAELRRTGIVFLPSMPHVMQACEEEVLLPWASLGPWLSGEGRSEVAALKAEWR
ncbi:DUF3298 domain-containing protein [Sphingomonas swuensis]|uniref:DUF3298 domain-containing protein n=2 Tax=Sphingomonas swuensis TaxID=977800 RepID=A0ABP7T6K3_9SPHN